MFSNCENRSHFTLSENRVKEGHLLVFYATAPESVTANSHYKRSENGFWKVFKKIKADLAFTANNKKSNNGIRFLCNRFKQI